MRMVRPLMRKAVISGSVASVVSMVALALRGRHELHDAAAPMNGPSQWVWGAQAPYLNGFSLRHTVIGYGIHHLASVFWAFHFEMARRRMRQPSTMNDVATAAATAAAAASVDNYCTPQRLRPGFEKRLTRGSLVVVYAAFGAGLAAGAALMRRLGR